MDELMTKCKEKMDKAVHALDEEYKSIRAGRANPHILDKITIDYYGQQTPLNQVGNISVADARCLVVSPWDSSLLKEIDKAILAANIGLTPTNDGKVIRLVFPQPTEERRKELVKQVQKMGEEAKVAIRNIRRDANDLCKKMKKDGEMTEDEQKQSEKAVQDLTDRYIKTVDSITSAKEKEILSL